jgi:PhnB protein
MASKPSPVPAGASVVSPYLIVRDAGAMIEFYKRVFGAVETTRMRQPDGRIGHAEVKIGGATVMLADEFPEMGIVSPLTIGAARSPVAIHVYLAEVDEVYGRALAAGATSLREPADQFYGDHNAQFRDPSGHVWSIATHVEDVSNEEVRKRLAAMTAREK